MITYPVIASKILKRLSSGPQRSTNLTKELGFSNKLIYQTIDEMKNDGLIELQTDLHKFKVYQITEQGNQIAFDSVIKSNNGLLGALEKSSELKPLLNEILRITQKRKTLELLTTLTREYESISSDDFRNILDAVTLTASSPSDSRYLKQIRLEEKFTTQSWRPSLENTITAT